eukprot:scaffold57857_cov31-Tisochrysis_lutea.AAC.5
MKLLPSSASTGEPSPVSETRKSDARASAGARGCKTGAAETEREHRAVEGSPRHTRTSPSVPTNSNESSSA